MTAWASDKAAFKLPEGTVVPIRITAVLIGNGGTWKLVQWHSSVGVPNKEIVGIEITTEQRRRIAASYVVFTAASRGGRQDG